MQTAPRSLLALVVVFLLVLAGCGRNEPSAAPAAGGSTPPAVVAPGASLAADRALVVTMDVAITVVRVDDAATQLRAAVDKAGGFVADAKTSGRDGSTTAQFELRVPASEARNIRASLGGL